MRATDHRYQKDQEKLTLAMNMLQLNARTNVIRKWTGLSGDRIRKLVKFYGATPSDQRQRGRYPSQSPAVSKNPVIRQQANLLAGLFASSGLMRAQGNSVSQPEWLQVGQTFCRTYEWFVQLEGESRISFEHALLLWRQLLNRTEVTLARCPKCRLLQVLETYRSPLTPCGLCAQKPPKRMLNG
jgi:Flagellar transcriptional activator (FlhC)